MRQQTFTLPTELVRRLEQRAHADGVSVEALVRQLVSQHLPTLLASAASELLRENERHFSDRPVPTTAVYTDRERADLLDRPEHHYLTAEMADEYAYVTTQRQEGRGSP